MRFFVRICIAVTAAAALVLGPGAAVLASPSDVSATQGGDARVAMPDMRGVSAEKAFSLLEDLGMDVRLDGKGRSVWKKSNWLVVSQKPKAEALVELSSKVTLVVVKKREIVDEGHAVPLCKRYAEETGLLPGAVKWPFGQFTSLKNSLGVRVEITGHTDDALRLPVTIRCDVEGTKKKPKISDFDVAFS